MNSARPRCYQAKKKPRCHAARKERRFQTKPNQPQREPNPLSDHAVVGAVSCRESAPPFTQHRKNTRRSGILPQLFGTSTRHIAAGRRSYESYGSIRRSGILPRLLGASTWHIAAGRRSYESYGSICRSGILPRLLGASTWRIAAGRRSYESYGSICRSGILPRLFGHIDLAHRGGTPLLRILRLNL